MLRLAFSCCLLGKVFAADPSLEAMATAIRLQYNVSTALAPAFDATMATYLDELDTSNYTFRDVDYNK